MHKKLIMFCFASLFLMFNAASHGGQITPLDEQATRHSEREVTSVTQGNLLGNDSTCSALKNLFDQSVSWVQRYDGLTASLRAGVHNELLFATASSCEAAFASQILGSLLTSCRNYDFNTESWRATAPNCLDIIADAAGADASSADSTEESGNPMTLSVNAAPVLNTDQTCSALENLFDTSVSWIAKYDDLQSSLRSGVQDNLNNSVARACDVYLNSKSLGDKICHERDFTPSYSSAGDLCFAFYTGYYEAEESRFFNPIQ